MSFISAGKVEHFITAREVAYFFNATEIVQSNIARYGMSFSTAREVVNLIF